MTKRFPAVTRALEVIFPPLAVVKKRLVVEAVVNVPLVLKRFVVVAEVPVAVVKVKDWRVVEER